MSKIPKLFFALWAFGVIGFEAFLVLMAGRQHIALPWLLVAPGFLVFLAGFALAGKWLARGDEGRMEEFLRRGLDRCGSA